MNPYGGVRAMSYVVLGAIGLRGLFSLSFLVMPASVARSIGRSSLAISGGLIFLAIVLTMIWIGMLFSAIRRTGIQTKWSPAFAALSFLIPFGNMILPPLAIAQASKYRGKSAGVVWGWWGLYIVHTIINASQARIPIPYVGLVILLAMLGLWGLMIFNLGIASSAQVGGVAPSFAPYPQPSYPPPQQYPSQQPPMYPPHAR